MKIRMVLAAAAALVASCAPSDREPVTETPQPAPALGVRAIDPPAEPGSFAPHLAASRDGVVMTWLERLPETDAGRPHRVRFARLAGGRWGTPATVAEGTGFFANWADIPGVVETGGGDLLAHWLAKTGPATYAYSIFLARSTDGGDSWTPLGPLNDDATQTEHGFVSWVPEGSGARAFWLDGRAMATGDPMSLRTAVVTEGVGPSEVIDPRVCECCSTDAAATDSGRSVVAFRDRADDEEIRDIAVASGGAGGWSRPWVPVADGWRIDGCPVNGPALAAGGERVALAWFTAADGVAVVRAALSSDGGGSFGAVTLVDGEAPLGRVDLAMAGDAAWVVWLASAGEAAEVRLRRIGSAGELSEPLVVGTTSPARASGFPRLVGAGERLIVAWTQVGEGGERRVRVAEVVI